MKKGQIEIVGLMIIVLLLFFGLIFYFQFSSKDSTDFIKQAEENLEVSNMLSTIRQYTVCENTQMSDVIKECTEKGFICDEAACEIVGREIPQLLSIYGWEENAYMFYIGEELYSPTTCSGNTLVDEYISNGFSIRLVYCN
jgi:hypothetical protein